MSNGSANAICTCVTSTDDHNLLAFGRNIVAVLQITIKQALSVGMQEFHGKMNSRQVPSFNRNIPTTDRERIIVKFPFTIQNKMARRQRMPNRTSQSYLGFVEPTAKTMASFSFLSLSRENEGSFPTFALTTKLTPSSAMRLTRL